MQIQAIKSFLMVYETQNITKASERLFVTQQCLSRQIKSVEDELGVKLFARQKTGMKPTEICHRLYPELQKMINCYERSRTICSEEQSKDTPKLILALANGMSNYIDFSSISRLVRVVMGQELLVRELPTEECYHMLINGECDMAFLLEPFDDTVIEHMVFIRDYGCIAMHKSHPLAKSEVPIDLSALDGIKVITGLSNNCATEHFWRYCSQTNVYPRCVAAVSNIFGFVNKLSQDDVAITVLASSVSQITNPNVVVRQVVNPPLLGSCHCCVRADAESIVQLRELMNRIKDSYAAH